jgi:hypothetical protein
MPLRGQGFLVIWHDIRTESEPDYHRWHTREHMPERLSIPGFLRGRRGVDWALEKYRYFTLYEGADTGVFGSPAYLQRLNNPTLWSNKLQPAFYNFVRSACDTIVSVGEGVGGAILTFRLPFALRGEADLRAQARAMAEAMMQADGVSSAHFGIARPQVSGVKTKETELRGMTQDGRFDAVALIDGLGRRELAAAHPAIENVLNRHGWKVPPQDVAIYDNAFTLDSPSQ